MSAINSGDTAWMISATSLVLLMTIPGLLLFYAGIVRDKNVIATAMQTFVIVTIITLTWLAFGYSLSFAPSNMASRVPGSFFIYGDGSQIWLNSLTISSTHQLAPTIPESVFCAYQLAFAIITAALICGSFADRMRFAPMMVFMVIWHLVVYCPIAHSIWHPEGWLYQRGLLDYAGGAVVHMSSGIAGLAASVVMGRRAGYGKELFDPHNVLLCCVGACLLWVGWFGFNAGSAYSAGNRAGYAMLCTQIASSSGALTWMFSEWAVRKKPSLQGVVSGSIAGLVCVTPASGFINPSGAFFIGFLSGPACYFGAQFKHYLGYDDALDAFGIHAIGGCLGLILAGFFATDAVNSTKNGVFYASGNAGWLILLNQLIGVAFVIAWSGFFSTLILLVLNYTIGLRVSEEEEQVGLDAVLHGETVMKDPELRIGEMSNYSTNIHGGDLLAKLNLRKESDNNFRQLAREGSPDLTDARVVPLSPTQVHLLNPIKEDMKEEDGVELVENRSVGDAV